MPPNDGAFCRKPMEMHILEEIDARSAATALRRRLARMHLLARPSLTEFDRTV